MRAAVVVFHLLDVLRLRLLQRDAVKMLDPVDLRLAFGELLALAELVAGRGEDVVITARLEHEINDVLHRHDRRARIIADAVDVAALVRRRRRRLDVDVRWKS